RRALQGRKGRRAQGGDRQEAEAGRPQQGGSRGRAFHRAERQVRFGRSIAADPSEHCFVIRLFSRLRSAVPFGGSDTTEAYTPVWQEHNSIRLNLALATEDAKPRSLISLLGEPPANIDEVLESVAVACRSRGEFPVAVMSELRPRLIATSTVPIEFIPTRRH